MATCSCLQCRWQAGGEVAIFAEHKDQNQFGVSGGMIWGVKKMVFNSIDFGVVVMSSNAVAA